MAGNTQRILVTGASGFVGFGLLKYLADRGYEPRAAVRNSIGICNEAIVGNIGPNTEWDQALQEVDCVVHLAGRAHVLQESEADPLCLYRAINTEGTRCLASAAARSGIRRFVFVSTIKVNGESTAGKPFSAGDIPEPMDPYAVSKFEAEQALQKVAARSNMEVCIIRPPLVYGPGVKGNLSRLINLVRSGIPLPFGAVCNSRSLVSIDNLHDLIVRCISHHAAGGQTLMVSDGNDLSTVELIRQIGDAMERPARLVPVPVALLRVALTLLGRQGELERLCGSLQVDIRATCEILDWKPPIGVSEGISRMVVK